VNLISCDCIEYLRFSDTDSVSFENSDLVLIAEVIYSGKEYKFVLIEKFKGQTLNDTLSGESISEDGFFDNCTYYPTKTGRFLLYLDVNTVMPNGETTYIASQCAASRSLDLEDRTYVVPSQNEDHNLSKWTNTWIKCLSEK